MIALGLGDVGRQTVNAIETAVFAFAVVCIALTRFFDKAVEEVFDVDA